MAFEKIQRGFFACFVVGDGLRVGRNHFVAERTDGAGVAFLLEAFFFDDDRRITPRGKHVGKHLLGLLAIDLSAGHQPDQRIELRRFDRAIGNGFVRGR